VDAILGFINANMVVIGFIWGLLVKYVPALTKVPNALIPWINMIVALLTSLAGPGVAHAAVAGVSIPGHTFLGHILGAGWAAIQSALIYEVFARHPLNAAGVKKA
jgi:ABC-type long-subunit fatty acid transport system fused permease/ATPase subunit